MMKTTGRIRGAAIVVALVAGILGVGATPAQAAVFNVTTTDATYDGVCDDHCSIRDALNTANGLPGQHTIFVPAGEYVLTGSLFISSNLTIQGVGEGVTLSGNRTDRVVEVAADGTATLKNLLITKGSTAHGGGAIVNRGNLVLIDSVVNASRSSIACGGGLLNLGTAHISESSVSGNTAPIGAGICNGATSTLSFTSSDLGFNHSTDSGGAIHNEGTAELVRARVGNNLAEYGGGIFNAGVLKVADSLVAQNQAVASGNGGGIYNLGTAEITSSRITANTAGSGGGIDNDFTLYLANSTVQGNSALFGGGISNSSILHVTNSTLAQNSVRGFDGGGLYNDQQATATFDNSTLSGNTAGNSGGAVFQSSDIEVVITSSTIVDNVAENDGGNAGRGGGLFAGGAGISLRNSILADNQNLRPLGSPDCFGALTSTGYNIIGDLDNCLVTLLETDSTGVPKVGPLANNGGPTPTHALTGTLGAIDHGPRGAACTGTDQRGVPRESPCDTGAHELVRCGTVAVSVVGTSQSEDIKGTGRSDGILALGGADRVKAGAGNDRICGGDGADELSGGRGNDKLYGGKGNDVLNGGPGKDLCTGGAGRDKLRSC